ncbi:MAG: class I SAM-dependent methyltransferase [Bdellovibrionaceae bacterium]|nr:class I SAM-dependent methyltransferase [Pseudobdellovibrionaceae bacterium]
MNIKYFPKDDLHNIAIQKIRAVDSIIDIGTGIMPRDHIKANLYICCEPFKQYVAELSKNTLKSPLNTQYLVLNTDWAGALAILPDKSIDTVMLVDVIEHLTKEEGERLLKDTYRIARKQIVLFTPLGFLLQYLHEGGKDAWGLDGADWQEHKSGWLPEDFDNSWEIIACKEYHLEDNLGRPMDEPAGAFWAFKNLDDSLGLPVKAVVDAKAYEGFKSHILELTESRDRLQGQMDKIRSFLPVKVLLYLRRMIMKLSGKPV